LPACNAAFGYLVQLSDMIAMLPLEDWQSLLECAEKLGPSVDADLYQQYLRSNGAIVLELIRAAIPLKRISQEMNRIEERDTSGAN
jgi:hypothetical protein